MTARLTDFAGEWTGTTTLYLMPDDPGDTSQTRAVIAPAAGGTFLTIAYTWSRQGKPHDGVLLVRNAAEVTDDDMVWVDSFHTERKFLYFSGRSGAAKSVVGYTTYPAPSGPDWGWRITVSAPSPDVLRILMHNITPDGQEAIAVDSRYQRRPG